MYVNSKSTVAVNVSFNNFVEMSEEDVDRVLEYYSSRKRSGFSLPIKQFLSIPIIKWDVVGFEVLENKELKVFGEIQDLDNEFSASGKVEVYDVIVADVNFKVKIGKEVMKDVIKILRKYKEQDMRVWLVEDSMMVIYIEDVVIYVAGLAY